MEKRGLQRSEIIKQALAQEAPDMQVAFSTEPLVTIRTQDPRYEAALRDYLAEPYIDPPLMPDAERGGIRFIDHEQALYEGQAAQEQAGLQEYLQYHLLGQRLAKFLPNAADMPAGYSRPKEHIELKPAYLLGPNEDNGSYLLATENAWPYVRRVAPLLETMIAAQGSRKASIHGYRENTRGVMRPHALSDAPPFIAVAPKARAQLLALDEAAFTTLAETAWQKINTQSHGRAK